MSFMRLGTRVAVFDDEHRVLLSKRGDFGIWALPGGRVDSGELLHDSAVREVQEETGLEVKIERAVGLYFQQGRSRTNILYRARATGGELFGRTDETLENRFFAVDDLPEPLFGRFYIDDARTDETHTRIQVTPRWELIKVDLRLRWRWVQNLLAGRPEPSFVPFDVRAVGIVWDEQRNQVLSLGDNRLVETHSDGQIALHEALSRELRFGNFAWKWIGLYQQSAANRLDFVFESSEKLATNLWVSPQSLADERHWRYVQQQRRMGHIWLMAE